MTLTKVETAVPEMILEALWGKKTHNMITDSFRGRGGLARWSELVRWVKEHPEFVEKGDVVIAGGSPVMLYSHLGYGFIGRKPENGKFWMSSDPFENPINKEFKVFLAFVEEDHEEPIYGDIEG